MTIRAKTKRRLVILTIVTLTAAAALTAAVVVRKQQRSRYYAGLRSGAITAFKAGNYEKTLTDLATYIKRYPNDAEAIEHLARARQQVDMPNGQHLLVAAQLYRRFLDLQPDRADIRREMAILYSRVGYQAEALDAASKVLEKKPDDAAMLGIKARALFVLRKSGEALPLAEKSIALNPMDPEVQLLRIELYRELGSRDKILPEARALLEKHPQDPRAEMVMGTACIAVEEFSPEQQKNVEALIAALYPPQKPSGITTRSAADFFIRQAAKRPAPDLMFVRLMVGQLDRLGHPRESAGVLNEALKTQDDPSLRRFVVRRLFELNGWGDAFAHLGKLKLQNSGADLDLQAIGAICQLRLGKMDEAAKAIDALAAIPNDRVAQGWSTILRQMLPGARSEPLKVVEAARAALEIQKNSPYLWYYLGEAYANVGERAPAIEAFREANKANPLWSLPLSQLARLYAESGQQDIAIKAAQAAAQINPSLATNTDLLLMAADAIPRDQIPRNAALVNDIAEIQRQAPGEERTLPLHVFILAKQGKQAEAEKAVRAALDGEKNPSESLLLRLAASCREAGLNLSGECYARSEKLHGMTASLANARARELLAAGKAAEGAALLENARRASGSANDLSWRMAWAKYLDDANDPRAMQEWLSLGEDVTLKSNLAVQSAALAAKCAQDNRRFLQGTIDRIRQISGPTATNWRMAQVVLLLRGTPTEADLGQASKLLQEVVSASPGEIKSRLLLAEVLERTGNLAGAAEQLLAAAKLNPGDSRIALGLAGIYQAQSDFQRAREQIDRVRTEQLDETQKRQFARVLTRQGEFARAATVMMSSATTQPSDQLMLAELYARQNEPRKAEPIYRELLKAPTAQIIVSAARFFTSTGRAPEGEKILEGLNGLGLSAADREMTLTEFYSQAGAADQALVHAKAAVEAAPKNDQAWPMLVTVNLQLGRVNDAIAAAEEGRKAVPQDKRLQTFAENADAIRALAADRGLVPIFAALLSPMNGSAASEAIKIIADGRKNNEPPAQLAAKLQPIAERSPSFAAIQPLVVNLFLAGGRPDDAVSLARRAAQANPASPELASIEAQALFAAGQFTESLVSANRWRGLLGSSTMPADTLIAQIQAKLGNTAAVDQELQKYLDVALANPERYMTLIALQAQRLVQQGKTSQAAEVLWPVLPKSAAFRRLWLELANAMAKDNPTLAAQWLQRIEPVMPASSLDDRISLAQVWNALGQITKNPQYTQKAESLLIDLTQRADRPAMAFFALGSNYEQNQQQENAEKAYRRALQIEPNLPEVLNNLSMVILRRNGDLTEAAALAEKAVQGNPRHPSLLDTLAQVQARAGKFPEAIANLKRAIALDPDEPRWRIYLASVHAQAGQTQEVKTVLGEIDSLVQRGRKVPADIEADLAKLKAKYTASAGN